MLSQEIQTLLSQPNNAIVGTIQGDGTPQLTPVWYVWDGEVFSFSTTRDRSKYLNIKRNPSISLIVDDLATNTYVTAYGKAQIIEQNVMELSLPIAQKYIPADRFEKWAQKFDPQKRIIILLRPDKLLTGSIRG